MSTASDSYPLIHACFSRPANKVGRIGKILYLDMSGMYVHTKVSK